MKRISVFLLVLMLVISLCGCGSESASTAVLLETRMAKADRLPTGKIYHSGVEAGEEGYASPTLLATLYGEKNVERCFSLVEEYAIYLSSFPEPCEIAVFRCYAKSDADRIAEMCLARKELLRVALAGTPYRTRADDATIYVDGKLIVMELLPPVNA